MLMEEILSDLITSKNNENIKYASKLISSSKFRDENQQFVIEGVRLCTDAIKSGVKIVKAFFTQRFCDKYDDLFNILFKSSDFIYIVDEKIIKIISDTKCSQGIVCICEMFKRRCKINNVQSKLVLLDDIQNPSNMGAIIRTCDALNMDGIIASKNSCDIYNPKVLRGSMGSVFRINFEISDNIKDVISTLNKNGFITIAMTLESDSIDIRNVKFSEKCAVVIGNEGNGIHDEIQNMCLHKVTIPINNCVDSLNASVATGIVMWEMTK